MRALFVFLSFLMLLLVPVSSSFAAPPSPPPHSGPVAQPVRPGHGRHPGAIPNHHRHHHYPPVRTYRRTSYYSPVIVYSDSSNVVSEPAVQVSETSYTSTGMFGFGIKGTVSANSSVGNITNPASGGLGFYFKFRPTRYFSIELNNDYLFGNINYDDGGSQSFVKVPLSLGTRFHFFDYGNVDAYVALAASMSFWSYPDGYDVYYDYYWDEYYSETSYMDETGIQFGGQFGLGVSYITGGFEIGADARYTIENVPDFIPWYESSFKNEKAIHGFLLTVSFGFSL